MFSMIERYIDYSMLLDPELTGGEDLSKVDYDKKDAKLKKKMNDTLDKRARRAWNRGYKETTIPALEEQADLPSRIKNYKRQIKERLQNMREDNFEYIEGKGYAYAEEAKPIIKSL